MKTQYIIILCVVCLITGFFAGRKTLTDPEPETSYIKGSSIQGNVPIDLLIPVRETNPEFPNLPFRSDTIYKDSIIYVPLKIDTAAIIADYITKREYTPVLFDSPKIGTLSLSATVQYNKISALNYSFTPITKEVIRNTTEVWQPYTGVSYNTLGHLSLAGGTFYHNLGLELQYIYDLNYRKKGYGIGFRYKF